MAGVKISKSNVRFRGKAGKAKRLAEYCLSANDMAQSRQC